MLIVEFVDGSAKKFEKANWFHAAQGRATLYGKAPVESESASSARYEDLRWVATVNMEYVKVIRRADDEQN